MTQDQFNLIQDAFIYVFGDILGYWLSGVTAFALLLSLYILFLALFRWLSGKGSLI